MKPPLICKKVFIVTGTRAEFGLLKHLIYEMNNSTYFNLELLVTGTHLSINHGETVKEIIADGISINHQVDLKITKDKPYDISKATSNGIRKFSKIYENYKPDLLIVLGDRYEILSAVIPACFSNIPIAHIHGGERTEGLIDESIRHAITKFSHIHFVANEEYRKRVIQMGENPSRVFNVGGLGVDAISRIKFLDSKTIENDLNIKFKKNKFLITYHPVTLDPEASVKGIKELLKSLRHFHDCTFIFTMPNADTNSMPLLALINEFVENSKNAFFFKSLGQIRYLSLLKICDGVIGNSSSGLLEMPFFKKATINIGDRQKGRLKAESVVDCEPYEKSITEAIKKTQSQKFLRNLKYVKCPYGDPGAVNKILKILISIDFDNLLKKSFYDLDTK